MKPPIALACATLLLLVGLSVASADSGDYRYKWPWLYTQNGTVGVASVPYTGAHACGTGDCTNAFDFTIPNDVVLSSVEGPVADRFDGYLDHDCPSDGHYGNFVLVNVLGLGQVIYGHLQHGTVTSATSLLQGDTVGHQGDTGHTYGDGPNGCGEHLHFGWTTAPRPNRVDGETTVPLQGPNSTNSVIGEYSTSGASLRQAYVSHGGWGSVGWTANFGSGLNMAQDFSWGKLQDFQHDPDGLGGGTNNTLTVRTSDTTHAYLVDSVFWAAWAGANPGLGLALADRGPCPAGFNRACISYQQFQFGFVWMDVYTGRTAVFCPDVSHNGVFDSNDISLIDGASGSSNPDYDVNGDGIVNTADHTLAVSGDVDGDGLSGTYELFTSHTNPCKADTDNDHCADGKELGTQLFAGGLRNPLNPWDFYDVPAPALWRGYTGQAPDGAIGNGTDVLALTDYLGVSPGSQKYDQDLDGDGREDGLEYDRSSPPDPNKPYQLGGPDGGIGLGSDILLMLAQVGSVCH